MVKTVTFFTLLFCLYSAAGQKLFLSTAIDTNEAGVKKTIDFFQRYLDAFDTTINPDYCSFWPRESCINSKHPDPSAFAISGDYPTYKMGDKRTVLSVRAENNYTLIETMFAYTDTANNITVAAITNHYINTDNKGGQHFINPFTVIGNTWQSKTVRNITFTFPPGHIFNSEKADSLIKKTEMLEEEWNLKPVSIRYYFAPSRVEIEKLRGIEYTLEMSNKEQPSGRSDMDDNVITCAGLDEGYFHEVVHIYLNRLFPKSPLREGIAVFYGGSMGHSLEWHRQRLKVYLQNHPEIDPAVKNFYHMDNYTNPQSTIMGLLCSLAYKKDGLAGLKRMMGYTSLDEVFDKEFGKKPGEYSTFLKQVINQ